MLQNRLPYLKDHKENHFIPAYEIGYKWDLITDDEDGDVVYLVLLSKDLDRFESCDCAAFDTDVYPVNVHIDWTEEMQGETLELTVGLDDGID